MRDHANAPSHHLGPLNYNWLVRNKTVSPWQCGADSSPSSCSIILINKLLFLKKIFLIRLPITNSWCIHRTVLISLVQPLLKLLPPLQEESGEGNWPPSREKLPHFLIPIFLLLTASGDCHSLSASGFHFGRFCIISEFMQYLSFCACLISVSTMSSRLTCVVTNDVILPHTRLSSVLLHLYYIFFLFFLFYFWDCVLLCCPSCAEPNRWTLPFHFCFLSS